jgi:hypothetical protein
MRILVWLGAWSVLTLGCRLIVPIEGLAGTEPSTSDGGSGGRGGGGAGGSDAGGRSGGDAEADRGDGKPIDAPADAPRNPPTVVIRGAAPITGITVNATDLYWVEGGNVFRAPKESQGGTGIGIDNGRTAFDVAVDANFIYWSNDIMIMHEVRKKPISNPPVTPDHVFTPGAPRTRYLAVGEEGQVFATDPGSINSSTRVGVPNGNIYSSQTEASGIAVVGNDLYWGYGGAMHGVRKGSIDGLIPQSEVVFTDLQGVVTGIATDGEDMYWIEDNRRVRRTRLKVMTGSISEVCSEPDAAPDGGFGPDSDLAVDDQWVYFSEPNLMRISKCAK